MKNKHLLKLLAVPLFLTFTLTGCGNPLSSMLDSYNDQFTPVYPDDPDYAATIEPGTQGFNQSLMLIDNYVVSTSSTINLSAPGNCTAYKWVIQDPENGTLDPVTVKYMNGFSSATKRFVAYIPDSGLKGGKTYRLCLTAYGKDNRVYEDYAGLAIYNDYFFSTGIVEIPVDSRSVVSSVNKCVSSARVVLPGAESFDDSLTFYIYAENQLTHETVGPKKVTVNKDPLNDMTGTLQLDLPSADYFITLMGVKEIPDTISYASIKSSCSLIGYANADLRYYDSANFVLKPDTETNAGSAKIKFYTNGWDFNDASGVFSQFEVGTMLTDNSGYEVTPAAIFKNLDSENLPANAPPAEVNYNISVKAGTYNLNVFFKRGDTVYRWIDKIVINGKETTEATIGIPLVIDEGIAQFKFYTEDFDLDSGDYTFQGASVTKVNGLDSNLNVTDELLASEIGTTEPSAANYAVRGSVGNYKVVLSFTDNDSYTYKWSCQFLISPGQRKTQTVGISSSDLQLVSEGG